ncbi:MAG: hypothetical protein R2874_17065 [Desulfobacterales bacterium]
MIEIANAVVPAKCEGRQKGSGVVPAGGGQMVKLPGPVSRL